MKAQNEFLEQLQGLQVDHLLIVLAHNGPTGLGSNMNDICGRNWVHGCGDHGDPDLAQAISEVKATTKCYIPLVVFGHMHKELSYGGHKKMINVGADNTIYLNGDIVPRVRKLNGGQAESNTFKIRRAAERWPSREQKDKTS